MKKRIILIILVVLALGVVGTGMLFAAGPGSRIPFLASNVELQVVSPFTVTLVAMGAPELGITESGVGTVYPGQRIAKGVLRIENRSPFDYGAYVRAEPQKALNNTAPYFEVKVWIGDTLFQNPKGIPAGTTVEIRIEIFIPYGAPISSFQGLDVIVEAGPPPTETIAKCAASGCRG